MIFFTSNLITCFIDNFTLKMTSQSNAYLLNKSEHIYPFWTLKVKCTRYRICGEVAFKIVRQWFFRSRTWRAKVFGRVKKIPISLWGRCPYLYLPPPQGSYRGGYRMPIQSDHVVGNHE